MTEPYKIMSENWTFIFLGLQSILKNEYFYQMAAASNTKIQLSYSHIKRWEVITGVTLISTLLVIGVFYLHPMNSNWYKKDNFSVINLIQFVFIDQFLFELITTFILVYAIGFYAKILKIKTLTLNLKGYIFYFVKFTPLYFLGYFFSTPITVSIRFLYHYLITQQGEFNYWESYFFLNPNLYLGYLLPLAIMITLLLIVTLLRSKNTFKTNDATNPTREMQIVSLKVKTDIGVKILPSNKISRIYKEGRKYFVYTDGTNMYEINKNLTELQKELGSNYVLINRSTLINLDYFEDYSFWENEKYVVRMKDGSEFNSTRERIKSLKQQIDVYNTYHQE